jgi:DNA-binding NtrC family response regulator
MPAATRQDLCDQLQGQRLAGNVRELRNIVERSMLLGRAYVEAEDEGEGALQTPAAGTEAKGGGSGLAFEGTFHDFQERAEREYLRSVLVKHAGHVADASQAAGVNRTYFYRLLKKHGL